MPAPAENAGPWLSVLIPAHNAASYIEACMRSVLTQADAGIELVVLEDASSDATGEVIQRVAQDYPDRVRLLLAERNRGVSAARNALLADARGRHVWFVDADDIVETGAVAQLRGILDEHDPDLVLCDFRYLRQARRQARRCTFTGPAGERLDDRSQLVAGLLLAGELHVWSKIGRREVWMQAPFPEGRCFEDIAVTLGLIRATRNFIHVHRAWIGYRQHPASIMATISPAKLRQWIISLEELRGGLAKDGLSPAALRALDYFLLRNFASVLRRAERLLVQEPALHGEFATAFSRLFPHGVGNILRDWYRCGWLLRAWRAQRALRKAGLP